MEIIKLFRRVTMTTLILENERINLWEMILKNKANQEKSDLKKNQPDEYVNPWRNK